MPVATVDPNEYVRCELKSAPPDGFVMLRPLPYGMKLTRRDKAATLVMRQKAPQKGGAKGRMANADNEAEEIKTELETASAWATGYDFGYCIGDHNLTDTNGVKLDFANPMSLKTLNPKIGSEIEKYLDELNEDEDDESLEDFLKRSDTSSTDKVSESPVLASLTREDTLVEK